MNESKEKSTDLAAVRFRDSVRLDSSMTLEVRAGDRVSLALVEFAGNAFVRIKTNKQTPLLVPVTNVAYLTPLVKDDGPKSAAR